MRTKPIYFQTKDNTIICKKVINTFTELFLITLKV